MEKRTVIVTGGNSGLGYQCAKNIAMKDKDYTLVLACRNPEKAAKAIQDIKTETGNKNIFSVALDLASLDSVRTFKELYKKEKLSAALFHRVQCWTQSHSAGIYKRWI